MRKWFFVLNVLFLNVQLSFAQNNLLEVRSSGSNLFIDHKVSAKESLYSLGRLYNVPPKELASYNKLALTKGLSLGQDLKIPLTQNNFSQTDVVNANEVLIPLQHTLLAHETLFRLSQQYNKVPLDQLKKWNQLQSDAIGIGTPLIIGFLKVDKTQSDLASRVFVPVIVSPIENKKEETPTIKPADGSGIATKEIVGVHEIEKKKESVPVVDNVAEEKVIISAPVIQQRIDFGGGIFKKSYDIQNHQDTLINTSNAMGSIFKSTSGWQDGKYYCFNNEAPAGTILKIMNRESGKSVYAKVLDVIPDIKQNSGLQIIISNAAADELGVGEKFDCEISQ